LSTTNLLSWRIYAQSLRYLLGTAILIAVLIGVSGSAPALRLAAQLVHRISAGQITIDGITGSLFSTLHIERIQLDTPTKTITLQQTTYSWSAKSSWQHQQLEITQLAINHLEILSKQPDNQPLTLPTSLTLPFAAVLQQAHINTLSIANHGTLITLQPVTFSLRYDRQHYQLQAQANSQWGNAQLQAMLADTAPYTLSSNIQIGLHDGVHAYDAHTLLTGTLNNINLNSQAQSHDANATITAQLSPFNLQPLTQAHVDIHNLNPATIANGLPLAMIDGQIDIRPVDANNYLGNITLANSQAGSLDQNKLPVTQITTQFNGSPSTLNFENLVLALGTNTRIAGAGKWNISGLALQLNVKQLDLHSLHNDLYATHLNGTLNAHADAQQQTFTANLTQADYAIKLAATYQQQQLNIASAQLNAGSSKLDFTGQMSFTGNHPFSASGQLKHFDPAHFGRYPSANINANFSTKGQIQPQLQTQLQLDIDHSSYNHATLSGHATVQITPQRINNSNVQLQLGSNTLNWQGSYGAPKDHITWQLNAPNIANLGDGFAGKVIAHGTLHGTLANPAGELNLQGEQIHWRSTLSLAKINAHINIASGNNGAVQADAGIQGIHTSQQQLQHAQVTISGTRHRHTINLTATNPQFALNTTLTGNWHDQRWDGNIIQLHNVGAYPFTLQTPAQLSIQANSAQLRHAYFDFAKGTVKLEQLDYAKSGITTTGSAGHIDTGLIQQSLYPNPRIHNTLIAGGKWQAHLDQQLDGTLEIWRETGDISIIGDKTTPLKLDRAYLTLQAQHNQLTAQLDIQGTTLGKISIQGSTTLAQSNHQLILSTHAPVLAQAKIDLPTLAWITSSLSDDVHLDGAMQAQVNLHSSLYAPVFNGVINASQLVFSHARQGIALQKGTFSAEFNQDTLHIKQLHFTAGGDLNVQGDIKINQGLTTLQLHAQATQLNLINRPERQVTLTGTANITGQNQRINAIADITIDHALLDLNDSNMPQLSNDVVIVGQSQALKKSAQSSGPATPAWQVNSDIKLNLGKHTQIRGSGLDARLTGTLKLAQRDSSPPVANGTISIADGTYTAFGQRLDINHGILNFISATDNPGVDILATRTYTDVTVGTQITGTALAPVAKLVSTPNMTDSEKLSWLVLGHGSEKGTEGADTKALQAAASYFLGQNNSISLQSRLTQLTGLDTIGIDGAGTLDSSMLSLGKRLSDQVYINYQQGLTSTKQLVKITYELSRRFSIRAQSGDESALDLFYTFRFD
jgi:translocation and assembly module TamB